MTTAEILEALKALPPVQRRALALALLHDDDAEGPSGASPVDTSHGWPVFTSPLPSGVPTQAFDHRRLRELHIDELVARALSEDRI
jgi:hypothetical protein